MIQRLGVESLRVCASQKERQYITSYCTHYNVGAIHDSAEPVALAWNLADLNRRAIAAPFVDQSRIPEWVSKRSKEPWSVPSRVPWGHIVIKGAVGRKDGHVGCPVLATWSVEILRTQIR